MNRSADLINKKTTSPIDFFKQILIFDELSLKKSTFILENIVKM